MKIFQSQKPAVNTFLSTAILLSVLWSFNNDLALAQQQLPAPLLPDPNDALRPGAAPSPADEPGSLPTTSRGFGGGGGGGGGLRSSATYYSADTKAYGYHPASAGPAVIIQFSQPDPQNLDTLQEDLNVMSLLLQKKLEDAVGENSPTYRMGIPLLLRSGKHGIESLYIDGFGAVFTVNVNFPLVAPPASKAKEPDDTTGSDDWDKARKELYGVRETEETAHPHTRAGTPYDAAQVGALKRALLDALKNAANIRGLKSEEWIAVTVFGAENADTAPEMPGSSDGGGRGGGMAGRFGAGAGGYATTAKAALLGVVGSGIPASRTGRGTVLNVRVRKADAESFAKGKMNLDQFEQKATITAYLGPAAHGNSAFWRGSSYPNRFQIPRVSR